CVGGGGGGRVRRASPAACVTASRMRGSSVATITRAMPRARRARSATWHTMGRPAMSARALPGRRVEPNRAGMTTTVEDAMTGHAVAQYQAPGQLLRRPLDKIKRAFQSLI